MYKHAIVRRPGKSAARGLTSVDLGKLDFAKLIEQHSHYTNTLTALGLEVVELEALEEFPDAYFTEDVAIVTPEISVIMRPGADARLGETLHITEALAKFRTLKYIAEPGIIDGGDVLIIDQAGVKRHCIVGLSTRTNQSGAEQLCGILSEYGYHGDIVDLGEEAPEALHFKSSVNFIDSQTLLVTQACFSLDCISAYRKLVVPEGEAYAANVVWINGKVLVADGYPVTQRLLAENGFQTMVMPVSEIAKMDGGLTCLSLRLT